MSLRQLRHSTGPFKKALLNAHIFTTRHRALMHLQDVLDDLQNKDLSEKETEKLLNDIITITKVLHVRRSEA